MITAILEEKLLCPIFTEFISESDLINSWIQLSDHLNVHTNFNLLTNLSSVKFDFIPSRINIFVEDYYRIFNTQPFHAIIKNKWNSAFCELMEHEFLNIKTFTEEKEAKKWLREVRLQST